MASWVDFRQVKSAVSMEMVLARYDIKLRRVNKTYLRGRCPLPTHPEGSDGNSFGVSTDKNAWACHAAACVAARDSRKGGNVLDFVARMEDCSVRDAALKLQDWFDVKEGDDIAANDSNADARQTAKAEERNEASDTKTNAPLDFELQKIDPTHEYLRRRGIDVETARAFGVGWFPGKGTMQGRVVIPIHDERGRLVAYAGRSVDGTEPKYKMPGGFRKSLVLYNLHRAVEAGNGEAVVVCEGFFDCLKIYQAGFPRVVSLMGATLSGHQQTLLTERFDRAVLMLDGDEPGREATEKVAAQLARRVYVRSVEVPNGKQPDELSSEELDALLSFI